MFNKKQIIRSFIFYLFCALILIVSFSLTYYMMFYDLEGYDDIENLELKNIHVIGNEDKCPNEKYFINSIYFKVLVAFFAGGIFSDGFFLKLGVF